MTSALENLFAMQLDAAGLTGYVREYQAIPGRKFRFDFAFLRERLLVEINGGYCKQGAPTGGALYVCSPLINKIITQVMAYYNRQLSTGLARRCAVLRSARTRAK